MAADAKGKKPNKLIEYFKGVRSELKKVAWPTPKEAYRYTLVVIAVCTFFALFFWILDTGFLTLLEKVLKISM
ncbi:MAG: preprotein translocase subunit SecE [Clostridiales bacterium]|nr:preprotein translocase subunit SecE [Clostridiales bacterium]